METLTSSVKTPDLFMVIGYFLLMLGIGLFFYRYMRRMKDFFSGGNSIPWWLSGVSFYMTSFSVAAFVFYPSICYKQGWVGITLLWVAIPATFFSSQLFARRWRRARIDSPVEYIEGRFSPALRQLFAWQGVPVMLIDDGIKLVATGTFISTCAGIDITYSILGAGAVMLLYTFMGGLWAVAVTDFVQFVVLTVGILVILPLSIAKAGGLHAIFSESPAGFFHATSADFGWSYLIPLVLLYSLGWSSTNWSLIQKYYCVPKEKDALKVGWCVIALYVFGPPIMFFPAIAAYHFIPDLADAGKVYPTLCAQLLPAGMLGLAIAAMLSATMSTLSGHYNVCASVLTNDVYRRLIHPNATERELVTVGRLTTVLIGVIAMGVALLMSRGKSENLFRMMVTLFGVASAPVAVPMLLGLVSRKQTNAGAIAGFVVGTVVGLLLYLLSRVPNETSFLCFLWKPATEEVVIGAFAMKTEIAMFLATSLSTLATMLVVSALAPMRGKALESSEAFHERLAAPIGTLPQDAAAGSRQGEFMSPFKVVGVCIFCISLMMLAVLWWAKGTNAFWIDLGLSALLFVIGALMAFHKRPAAKVEQA